MAARWDDMRLRAQRVDMKWFSEQLTIDFGPVDGQISIPGVLTRNTEASGYDPHTGVYLNVAELAVWRSDFGAEPEVGTHMDVAGTPYQVLSVDDYGDIINIELQGNTF